MNETENRDHDRSLYSSNGDEEIDASLMRVRHALLSLPKASCPVGFEYRLNRRLEGMDNRPRETARSWMSGWLGVGLGFACAAVVALFVLNFNGATTSSAPMAGKAEQVAPARITPSSIDQVVPSTSPEALTVSQPENPMASTDTVQPKDDPTYLSPNQLHQASGAEDPPANR